MLSYHTYYRRADYGNQLQTYKILCSRIDRHLRLQVRGERDTSKSQALHRVTYDILGVLGAVFGFFRGDKNLAGKTHVLGHQSHPVPRLLLQIPFLEAAVYYLLLPKGDELPAEALKAFCCEAAPNGRAAGAPNAEGEAGGAPKGTLELLQTWSGVCQMRCWLLQILLPRSQIRSRTPWWCAKSI